MTDVHDVDGAPAAIRAGIIATGGMGNVFLKAGTFPWNGETVAVPDGVNILTTGYAGCSSHPNWTTYVAPTILHNNVRGRTMFSLYRTTGSRISGIQMEATPPTTPDSGEQGDAIVLTQCKNFRVDHCTLINFAADSIVNQLNWEQGTSAYGLVDHCYLYEPYKLDGRNWLWAYGIYGIGIMSGGKGAWDPDLSHFLGKYQAVTNCAMTYMEDCHFSYNRHATDGIQGAWNVVRYCLCDHNYPNYGSIDLHGPTGPTSDDWYGGRGMEAYENTINGVEGENGNNASIRLRGGAGFFFNNKTNGVDPASYGIQLDNYDGTNPAMAAIHDTYVWNNTAINCIPLNVLQGILNTDYWRGTLTQNPDGSWTLPALAGKSAITYMPYTYPHPLTWGDEPLFDLSIKANIAASFNLDKILSASTHVKLITRNRLYFK